MAKELTPISLQLYSVREAAAKDFFGVLKEVAGIGYTGVETAGLHNKTPREVRTALDGLGLVASSGHLKLPTLETLNEVVDTAKTLGFNTVVCGHNRDLWKTADGIKQVAADLLKASELVKPHGLRVAYHNHWWEFDNVDGQCAYDLFMAAAPGVLGELDVYWAANFGAVKVVDVLKKYKARLPILHIKDGPLVRDQPHTAVGKGKMDIPAGVRAADPQVTRWFVVELDACATDMMTAVRESYQYMVSNGLAKGRK